MSSDQRSVLVIGPSWVGDLVLAQAFLMALRDRGVAAVDVVTPPGPFPLLERIPEVREAFVLKARHGELGLGVRWEMARHLKTRNYDQAYILPSSLKSALLPALAGIPVRTGHRGEFRFGLVNDIRPELPDSFDGPHRNVRGFLGLVAPEVATADVLPRPRLRVDGANQKQLAARFDLGSARSVIALAPGSAFGPSKRWPAEHFRSLAQRLAGEGRVILVIGGPAEKSLGEEIVRDADGSCLNLCGQTSLTDAVDLLALADVTVANDSGLAHVAGAVGSPVVVLFGPTSPRFSAPLTDRSEKLHLGLDCSPCGERTCPLGHHRCLRDITPDEVMRRIEALGVLEEGARGKKEAEPETGV
jgi:heptosyltransferase-2